LRQCQSAAELSPGLFSLTVPTGGGKTLSSLSFAVRHAIRHDLDRIVYVIPYTSIIEQNAAVFREALGSDAVLEHHSNFEPRQEDHRTRLACENWSGPPVIVTTNVQFFESLFANRSTGCRKLHNVARSVVVLDEAQMLPPALLLPCLAALRELVAHYGSTVVLCTATQPAFDGPAFERTQTIGHVREITHRPEDLYEQFRRVRVVDLGTVTDDVLADRLRGHDTVMCVVNTRRHARELFEALACDDHTYHLSALMCPAHRAEKLAEIKGRLAARMPTRLVSTQLIEAGVDISFPVVYRALAGIDSIAQAAGRCNREGEIERGQVRIFLPERGIPPQFRQQAQAAQSVLRHFDDPLSLEAVKAYFDELFWQKGEACLDTHGILDKGSDCTLNPPPTKELNIRFRSAAEAFRLIPDTMRSLIIPWGEAGDVLVRELRIGENTAQVGRRLQRYTVSLPRAQFAWMETYGVVDMVHGQYPVLLNMDLYSDELGLSPDDPTYHQVESLIC